MSTAAGRKQCGGHKSQRSESSGAAKRTQLCKELAIRIAIYHVIGHTVANDTAARLCPSKRVPYTKGVWVLTISKLNVKLISTPIRI
jgi:hypothetical protein